MQSIIIAPEERKDLILRMKREAKPSRRLRMHIALLASDGRSPTEIARALFCSRTTVYAVAERFLREGEAAFDDRWRRGPEPLLGEEANERLERLLEEDSPTSHGWLRSPASLELQAARPATAQRAGHRGEPGDTPTGAPSPRLPLEEAASGPAREELRRANRAEESETRRRAFDGAEKAGSFFQEETKLETNPKVGFYWMREGKQKPLRTPGTNRKVWISGALNFKTGRLHWVAGERRNDELFIRLLEHLRKIYRCHKELRLATDNDSSHTSKRVRKYVEDSGGRIRLYPLPSWSPESNPVEVVVWLSLHEAVSRNHECAGLDDLVELAEDYLEETQPFRLKLGEVYDHLERPPP